MGIEIKTRFSGGSLKTMQNIANMAKDTKKGIRRANYLIGKELVKDAKQKILKGKKTGIVYRRRRPSGRIVKHRSSAPGEAPANFTGALRASVDFVVRGQVLVFGAGGSATTGRLKGKNVVYAKDLEIGNRRKHLLPRPYLKATIDDEEKIIRNFYNQYIKKQLRKKGY